MKTVGLITEYNPFHLGHRYHIEKAKELTGADSVIVIMSGNYVQRGEPAFADKYTRTNIALNNGADMVIELPFCFACASAEYFAYAAVTILDRLNIIDYLCFGAENTDIGAMTAAADILVSEPAAFKAAMHNHLSAGLSFPAARALSLKEYLHDDNMYDSLLLSPNNILGIEYIKALKKRNSKIKPVAIQRIHAGYHDSDIKHFLYSATSIRTNVRKYLCDNTSDMRIDMLDDIDTSYSGSLLKTFPILTDDFSLLLGQSLISLIYSDTLNNVFGMTDTLSNKIINNIQHFHDYDAFTALIKSKDISYTAVSRALLHCILGITDSLVQSCMAQDICDFIRILGFREHSSYILGKISSLSDIRLITQMADWKNILSALKPHNSALMREWIKADDIYRMVCMNKFKTNIPNEYSRHIIKIK